MKISLFSALYNNAHDRKQRVELIYVGYLYFACCVEGFLL